MTIFTFIRHGNAEEQSGKGKDHGRPLSKKGVAQARDRRKKLGNPMFDLVISSSASRCVRTAEFIAGEQGPPEIVVLSRLYFPQDSIFWKVFDEIGYAPLREWLKRDPDNSLLERYGKESWEMINAVVSAANAKKVLVLGHAPPLNAIGVQNKGRLNVEKLYDVQLGECEGFSDDGTSITIIQG